jgi:hypothetical protein
MSHYSLGPAKASNGAPAFGGSELPRIYVDNTDMIQVDMMIGLFSGRKWVRTNAHLRANEIV